MKCARFSNLILRSIDFDWMRKIFHLQCKQLQTLLFYSDWIQLQKIWFLLEKKMIDLEVHVISVKMNRERMHRVREREREGYIERTRVDWVAIAFHTINMGYSSASCVRRWFWAHLRSVIGNSLKLFPPCFRAIQIKCKIHLDELYGEYFVFSVFRFLHFVQFEWNSLVFVFLGINLSLVSNSSTYLYAVAGTAGFYMCWIGLRVCVRANALTLLLAIQICGVHCVRSRYVSLFIDHFGLKCYCVCICTIRLTVHTQTYGEFQCGKDEHISFYFLQINKLIGFSARPAID